MAELRKYGVGATFIFPLFTAGTNDFKVDAAHASGDSVISKDEGAQANTTNGFVDEGSFYSIALTATEMQAARIAVIIIDQGTKAYDDQMLVIETYGHASAQHEFDLDTASTAQTGDNYARIGAPVGASISADVAAVKTQTGAIETDTQDIQSRLPAALTAGGNIKADALAFSGDTVAADNAESFFDGTGYAGTNNVIPTVTTLTNLPAITANWLTAAGTAADFTTEIQTGLATAASIAALNNVSSADVSTAVWNAATASYGAAGTYGLLVETNLDAAITTRLSTAGYTAPDNASISAILTDTAEIGAAGAGLTALATAANLATVDTVVDAIKAKTDSLTFTVAGQVDANAESMNGAEILGNGSALNLWRGV